MDNKKIKVVLAGGGTGGHIIPALAIADEITARGGECSFVGTKGRIEEKMVPAKGYCIDYIKVLPLADRSVISKLKGVAYVPVSLFKSMRLLLKAKPDVVVGVGGYVAGPVVLAARLMGIKTACLEQNATIGLANKLLKNIVHKAFVSYEETISMFPGGKAEFTGNPVKESILEKAGLKKPKNNLVNILVMGGSQGASTIDSRVPEAIKIAGIGPLVSILHQAKRENLVAVENLYKEANAEAKVTSFIEDTASEMQKADLVVARSGATTVAELTVMGLPAVFLPYPYHKDRQQEKNAAAMKEAGAAIVLDEMKTDVSQLAQAISFYVKSDDNRKKAAKSSRTLARPEAAKIIVDRLFVMKN